MNNGGKGKEKEEKKSSTSQMMGALASSSSDISTPHQANVTDEERELKKIKNVAARREKERNARAASKIKEESSLKKFEEAERSASQRTLQRNEPQAIEQRKYDREAPHVPLMSAIPKRKIKMKDRAYVGQSHAAIYTYDSKQKTQYLATSRITTCVGVSLWLGSGHTGLLVHFDDAAIKHMDDYITGLLRLMKDKTSVDKGDLTVVTIASDSSEPELLQSIKNSLDKSQCEHQAHCTKPFASEAIALDLKSGEIVRYTERVDGIAGRASLESGATQTSLGHPPKLNYYQLKDGRITLVNLPNPKREAEHYQESNVAQEARKDDDSYQASTPKLGG